MNSGQCTKEQVQGWVYNRFYYQIAIPLKDAAIMSNMPDRDQRRQWIQRIIDHDGTEGEEGGIEAWLRLGEACGSNARTSRHSGTCCPACASRSDAYINFGRTRPGRKRCAHRSPSSSRPRSTRSASIAGRSSTLDRAEGYYYFKKRLSEARRDVEHGLAVTLDYFKTRSQQERALDILQFKLDVLWSMLDAMQVNLGIGEAK